MGATGDYIRTVREMCLAGRSVFAARLGLSVRDLAKLEDEDPPIDDDLAQRANELANDIIYEKKLY